MSDTANILELVALERERQREQWGDDHDDQHTMLGWAQLLGKWVMKVGRDATRPNRHLLGLQDKLVKVAAIAVAAAESIDRRRL